MAVGNLVENESLSLAEDRKVVAQCPPWLECNAYGPRRRIGTLGYINTRADAKAGTIAGAAEYFRQLDRQAMKEARTNPDVVRWLRCAVKGAVLAGRGEPEDLVVEIFRNSGDPELEA